MEGVLARWSRTGAGLTAAFPSIKEPGRAGQETRKDGRLEPALRPPRSPAAAALLSASGQVMVQTLHCPAPGTDQYFLALRLALARDAALKVFKKAPGGLVSPGGVVRTISRWRRPWARSGWPAGRSPLARPKPDAEHRAAAVLEAGGVYAVPFVNFSTAPSYAAGLLSLFSTRLRARPRGPAPCWPRS